MNLLGQRTKPSKWQAEGPTDERTVQISRKCTARRERGERERRERGRAHNSTRAQSVELTIAILAFNISWFFVHCEPNWTELFTALLLLSHPLTDKSIKVFVFFSAHMPHTQSKRETEKGREVEMLCAVKDFQLKIPFLLIFVICRTKQKLLNKLKALWAWLFSNMCAWLCVCVCLCE